MPCNPLPSSKDMQDPEEWDTGNWEMQRKLCFQRVDQISRNGLKLQAWIFLAEPAFLRLIPAPGWNKAVSVTWISCSWFSHLNFKAHCRWLFLFFFFLLTKLSQDCLEIILQSIIDQRSVALTFKGQRNPLWAVDGEQDQQSVVQGLSWCSDRARVGWRCCFLLCLGVAVSQPLIAALQMLFSLSLWFFSFCTCIDF